MKTGIEVEADRIRKIGQEPKPIWLFPEGAKVVVTIYIYLIAFFPLFVALWLFAVVMLATILGYLFSWAVHVSEKNFKDYEDL